MQRRYLPLLRSYAVLFMRFYRHDAPTALWDDTVMLLWGGANRALWI